MSLPFAIKPAAGIFRSVINGDDAISPSSPRNVAFDAFGAKVHGMTLDGIVPFSSFSGPLYYQIVYPYLHLSNAYFMYTFTYPQPLDYCPLAVVRFQKPDGTWTAVYSQTAGGVLMTGGFVSTQTELLLYTQSSTSVGASSAQPLNVSYRLFGV